jgi:hypothetical protein
MKLSMRYAVYAFCLSAAGFTAPLARADGGAIVCSKSLARYRVTVFASPSPLSVGLADFSVLVQGQSTALPYDSAQISVIAFPKGNPDNRMGGQATREASTNKLLRALSIELSEPGCWLLEVTIADDSGTSVVAGEFYVNPPVPSWITLGMWIAWPFPVLAVFLWRKVSPRR